MRTYKFTKKTIAAIRSKLPASEKFCEGYTVDISGFPFAIVKCMDANHSKYWVIANRISGEHLFFRFSRKQEAERFFQEFSEKYDISDLEFRNPHSEFDYRKAAYEINKAIKQKEYMKKNFGKIS